MNKKGFSLIEVMISVAILAAIGLMLNSLLSGTLTSKSRVEKRDELLHAARIGITKITEDLSQAFLASAPLKGKESTYATGLKGNETQVDFSTLSHFHYQKNAKDTDQVTVGYRLESDQDGLSRLYRRQTPRLSDKIDREGVEFSILENVKVFKLSYYDASKEEWVQEWDTESISTQRKLPMAIKIELTLVDVDESGEGQDKEHVFSTVAAIDLYKNEISF